MSLIEWEYLRQTTGDLDREHGRGWEEVGTDFWELVAIYPPPNLVTDTQVAVFKRNKQAFEEFINPEPEPEPPSRTLGRAHNE